ncbi:hypothetical protein [Streptomyces alboniger]|uniref:Secreted protein n=1 Tax=Streptomyces alboniger TaxID=132473 RepID=A0A5J6HL40_STRAD|nr:hypothetical protein [Streptomyces alboniger]QEV17877.1 hypothetical protein CP975_10490 [Streptomyces alboniger]
MSTVMIIVLIVVVVVLAAGAFAVLNRKRLNAGGGHSLKRRFGPEYDRAVARHDGDTKAAERDLEERVKRHGSLRPRPLEPAAREQYSARWNLAQERFVDSPREAVADADRLIAELAGARGFPDAGHYEDQLDALSVHHAAHVHGYRRVHRAALDTTGAEESRTGTEEMREAMIEARALFDDLVADQHDHSTARSGKHTSGKRSTGITRRGVQHG